MQSAQGMDPEENIHYTMGRGKKEIFPGTEGEGAFGTEGTALTGRRCLETLSLSRGYGANLIIQ